MPIHCPLWRGTRALTVQHQGLRAGQGRASGGTTEVGWWRGSLTLGPQYLGHVPLGMGDILSLQIYLLNSISTDKKRSYHIYHSIKDGYWCHCRDVYWCHCKDVCWCTARWIAYYENNHSWKQSSNSRKEGTTLKLVRLLFDLIKFLFAQPSKTEVNNSTFYCLVKARWFAS